MFSSPGSRKKLGVLLLASEWGSSQGGLSTMNRELAIYLAKHPNVAVSFLVPSCREEDKRTASNYNITILEAQQRPGYEPIDSLSFPPRDMKIDIIIGHDVKLGKQGQIIRETHNCKWIQVVHTAPEELAMFKTYSGAISRGEEKHFTEVKLCEMADLVVAVGPKLFEVYSAYLSSCDKIVFNLTPGIFTELSNLKRSAPHGNKFRILVFGRGDSEDFELKGFDIAAQAVAALNDRSYHLIVVGAPRGSEEKVVEKLLMQGLRRRQLTVRKFLENRENLGKLLCEANLAIIPSRTEGFGMTALEALSACLPFLVSQNSGFGEALGKVENGLSCVVSSENPQHWAEAIKELRKKSRETRLKECQALRTHYDEKYSWKKQCAELVKIMCTIVQETSYVTTLECMFKEMSLTPTYTSDHPKRKAAEWCPEDIRSSELSSWPEEQMLTDPEEAILPELSTSHGLQEEWRYQFMSEHTADKEGTPNYFVDFELAAGRNARGTKQQPTRLAIPDKWQRQLAPNETLLLKTRILNSKVSLNPNHVEYRRPNWTVPRYIIVQIERENRLTQFGELFIVLGSNGKLRFVVPSTCDIL